jgi:hypothetical protein
MELYKQLFLSNELCHPDRRGHVAPYVDQVIAFAPESQKLPDYPLAGVQQGYMNDDHLFAFRLGSQI